MVCQNLIQNLVARKLQSASRSKDLCFCGPTKAFGLAQAARKALCVAAARPKK